MKQNEKKNLARSGGGIIFIIIGIIFTFLLVIGVSYAVWWLNFAQNETNRVVSACFSIILTEETDALTLKNTYPVIDEEGKKIIPYTFTIENKCSSYVKYQINLEVLKDSMIDSKFIKIMLNEEDPVLLTSKPIVEKTLENASNSYKLEIGSLDKLEKKQYHLRLWLDEFVTPEDNIQNKLFASQITIEASYITKLPSAYEKCIDDFGGASPQCQILALSEVNQELCPTVNADGTVNVTTIEDTNSLVCKAPDDAGMSYYFRGNVENNYVKFGGFYWRILRINGDGSIRMIYAGDASIIDGLSNKADVLKNTYDDSTTKYTQIGESAYNEYWKHNNIDDGTNSLINFDNAGLGYMYGNRDGIVEASSTMTNNKPLSADYSFNLAKEYIYDEATDRFSLKDPIEVLNSNITSDYVGYYFGGPNQYIYILRSVTPNSDGTTFDYEYSYVTYGTTSKAKAQENINESTTKIYLDTWYQNNFTTEEERYLSDSIYCNDRSIIISPGGNYSQLSYGAETTKYRGYAERSKTNIVTLNCKEQNDRFTVNNVKIGNGALTYPIGLLNRDEAAVAGGGIRKSANLNYYLHTELRYSLMTPALFFGTNPNTLGHGSHMGYIAPNGKIMGGSASAVNFVRSVRPVINLKPNSLKIGNGTSVNPYQVN